MLENRKWLKGGQQTKSTPEIKRLAKQLKSPNDYESVFSILRWIKKNLKFVKSWRWREKYLRKRSAHEVIKSGKSSGCGDSALVFAALIRANNIPARVVECIDRNWLLGNSFKSISGHVFVDVYVNGRWRVVDPAMGNLGMVYNWSLGKEFVVYKKGLDCWGMGIRNYKELETRFNIFKRNFKRKSR